MKKLTFKTLEEAELHASMRKEEWAEYYCDEKRYDGITERHTYRWKKNKLEYAGCMYVSLICSNCGKHLSGLFQDTNLSVSFCVFCGYDRSKPVKPDVDKEYVHYL